MKKTKNKIIFIGILLLVIGGMVVSIETFGRTELIQNVDCKIDVDFDLSDSKQMKDYLLSGTWTYKKDKIGESSYEERAIFIKLTEDLFYAVTDRLYLQEGESNDLGYIHIDHQLENRKLTLHQKKNPLFITDYSKWSEEFIAMDPNSFVTLVSLNADSLLQYFEPNSHYLLRYEKNDRTKANFDGTYHYKGKTFIIEGEDLYYQEADRHYLIHQMDDQRLYVDGQVISEVPSYHFWIDEEGNIILFSEGMKIDWLENQEIMEEYPFYVLEKQK